MFEANEIHIVLGPGDKESPVLNEDMEPGKIDVTTVHDVNGPGFQGERIERVDIVNFSVGDVDKAWDISP